MPGFTVFLVMSADPARPAGAKGVPGGTAEAVPAAVPQCCAGGAFMRSLRHSAASAIVRWPERAVTKC